MDHDPTNLTIPTAFLRLPILPSLPIYRYLPALNIPTRCDCGSHLLTAPVDPQTLEAYDERLSLYDSAEEIARKLQIHSASGLTIYAIVNKLVELSDIKQ